MHSTTNIYRPLLKPISAIDDEKYIDLPYCLTLLQIEQFRQYLPVNIIFSGIDCCSNTTNNSGQSPLGKYRNKIIGVAGYDHRKNKKIQIVSGQQYFWKQWEAHIVLIFPDIEITRRSSRVEDVFRNKIQDSLILINEDKKQVHHYSHFSAQEIDKFTLKMATETLSPFKLNNLHNISHNSTKKTFVGKIKTGLLLERNKQYTGGQLLHALSEDICSSITIMDSNQLFYRQLKLAFNLIPLQNFSKTNTQQKKFSDFFKKIADRQIDIKQNNRKQVNMSENTIDHKLHNYKPSFQQIKTAKNVSSQSKMTIVATAIGLLLLTLIYLYVRYRFFSQAQQTETL